MFEAGVQGADPTHGHVAWVDSHEQRADGRYINITEMDGVAGPGTYDTRTVKDFVGMSYRTAVILDDENQLDTYSHRLAFCTSGRIAEQVLLDMVDIPASQYPQANCER